MQKILKILFPIVAVVLGIVAIVIGVQKLHSKNLYDASAKAVITGIEREWKGTNSDGYDEYDYTVHIRYEIDGKKYEDAVYPGYDSSMKVGDEVEILYQTSNPENIAEGNITGNSVIIIVIGAVITLGGLFMTVKAFLRR